MDIKKVLNEVRVRAISAALVIRDGHPLAQEVVALAKDNAVLQRMACNRLLVRTLITRVQALEMALPVHRRIACSAVGPTSNAVSNSFLQIEQSLSGIKHSLERLL